MEVQASAWHVKPTRLSVRGQFGQTLAKQPISKPRLRRRVGGLDGGSAEVGVLGGGHDSKSMLVCGLRMLDAATIQGHSAIDERLFCIEHVLSMMLEHVCSD